MLEPKIKPVNLLGAVGLKRFRTKVGQKNGIPVCRDAIPAKRLAPI
jgi:hypothetical protein